MSDNVSNKELVKALSEKSGVSQKDCKRVLDSLKDVVIEFVQQDRVVQIPGFLKIATKQVPAQENAWNPATKEYYKKEAYNRIHLKASNKFKEAVR